MSRVLKKDDVHENISDHLGKMIDIVYDMVTSLEKDYKLIEPMDSKYLDQNNEEIENIKKEFSELIEVLEELTKSNIKIKDLFDDQDIASSSKL